MNMMRAARQRWFARHVLPLLHRLHTMEGHIVDRLNV